MENDNIVAVIPAKSEEIVHVVQLPIIEEQVRQLKESILADAEAACGLSCTEENRQEVKETRRRLNAKLKALEDQRKAVKKQVLAPYNEFEQIYKSCIGPMQGAIEALDGKVAEVEDSIKHQSEVYLRGLFAEECAVAGIDWLTFDRLGLDITLSVAQKAGNNPPADDSKKRSGGTAETKLIHDFVTDVAEDLSAIIDMEDSAEILSEFKRCLSMATAICKVKERKEATQRAAEEAECRRQEREAQRQHEAEIAAAAPTFTPAPAPVQAPAPVAAPAPAPATERVVFVKFKVTGTVDQLRKLKAFMNQEEITYESI